MSKTLDESVGAILAAMSSMNQRDQRPTSFCIGQVTAGTEPGLKIQCDGLELTANQIWINEALLEGYSPKLSGTLPGTCPDGRTSTPVTESQLTRGAFALKAGDRVVLLADHHLCCWLDAVRIHMFRKILRVLISLLRCLLEPLPRNRPILRDFFSHQVELAKGVLGILVSLLRRGGQPADGSIRILGDVLSLEEQFPKAKLGVLIPTLRRAFQPSDGGDGITGQCCSREIQPSQYESGGAVSLLRRFDQQLYRLGRLFW